MKIVNRLVRFSFNSKESLQAGFSLLELAIVLVILGIIGGVSLPLFSAHMTRNAHLKTRAHQDYALNAIAAFVEKNHRFPCPADPQVTGPEFGVMQIQCRGAKARGILPFKTLGISENFARDGYKRLMTYVIEQELAKKDTTLQKEPGGLIMVKNEENVSVLAAPLKDDRNPNYIALVLISHGESGIGSFLGKGQSTKLIGESPSAQKRENYDDNFIFIESSQTDDILRWESRDQFLKHYVKLRN